MLVEKPGTMESFTKVSGGRLFLTFLGEIRVFGVKIKTKTGLDAVLHLADGDPKIVQEDLFVNRDVFLLKDPKFQFPPLNEAKSGNPDHKAFGSVIVSAEGTFVRASHSQGPFDVDLERAIAGQSRNHPGSIWFDSWEVILPRGTEPEVLFERHKSKAKR
jgi:hypothetical protein